MHSDITTLVPPAGLDDSWADTLDRLRAFVAARVEDRELAADITQDVIVRSIASGALDRVDNPAAWLYRSARNAVIDHYRTRRSSDPLTDLDAWPDPDESTIVPTRQPGNCRAACSHCSINGAGGPGGAGARRRRWPDPTASRP